MLCNLHSYFSRSGALDLGIKLQKTCDSFEAIFGHWMCISGEKVQAFFPFNDMVCFFLIDTVFDIQHSINLRYTVC